MKLGLDPRDKNFAAVLRAKNAVMSAAMTAMVRVDSSKLRARNNDRIAELLNELKQTDDPDVQELFS
jgi:hypothetical protein